MYEYIEVRNTGGTDIDLAMAYIDDIGGATDAASPIAAVPNTSTASNTIVPAGGVAVIYDGFLATGSPANFDDNLFRTSWGLDANVKLIGADFFPSLNNDSPNTSVPPYTDGIGIWLNHADYELDVDRMATPAPNGHVTGYAHAAASVVYQSTAPWPTGVTSGSIQWSGTGNNSDGATWYKSVNGQNGAVTNTQVTVNGATNSASDVGNPGILPGGVAPAGLRVTEIMYNPRSPEGQAPAANWEWVEVLNNTGAAIDFGATPYVIDDLGGANITAANLDTGLIPIGSTAILYNKNAITIADMQAAWGNSINFIPINVVGSSDYSLNNTDPTGDTVGIWSSLTSYQTETGAPTARTFTNAIASVDYDNNANGWPNDDGNGSIYLSDLSLDPTVGANWLLSTLVDGLSYGPNLLTGTIVVDPGGAVGSPGSFAVVELGLDGDFNDDGKVDAADYTDWRDNLGAADETSINGNGDGLNGVDAADYDLWKLHFGEMAGSGGLAGGAVPEPTSLVLLMLGLTSLAIGRRTSQR
jgi:hypothetical protein